MTYENLKTRGTLREVGHPTLVERVTNNDLISPEIVYLTRVNILYQDKKNSASLEVFGIVPRSNIGKTVELIQSYHKLPNSKLFMQEFYVEGERIINASVVRRT